MDVRRVVRLDRCAELHVDRVDLTQDLLRLRLLRAHGRISRRARSGDQRPRNRYEKNLRVSFPRIGHQRENSNKLAHRRGPVRHKWRTLATGSDERNQAFKPKSAENVLEPYVTKSAQPGKRQLDGTVLASSAVRGRRETRRAPALVVAVGLVLTLALPGAGGAD